MTRKLHSNFEVITVSFGVLVRVLCVFGWAVNDILVTALSPNSIFPLLFELWLGCAWAWTRAIQSTPGAVSTCSVKVKEHQRNFKTKTTQL